MFVWLFLVVAVAVVVLLMAFFPSLFSRFLPFRIHSMPMRTKKVIHRRARTLSTFQRQFGMDLLKYVCMHTRFSGTITFFCWAITRKLFTNLLKAWSTKWPADDVVSLVFFAFLFRLYEILKWPKCQHKYTAFDLDEGSAFRLQW